MPSGASIPLYPESLNAEWPNGPNRLATYGTRLREDSQRVFLDGTDQYAIKVLHFAKDDSRSYIIRNAAELLDYFQGVHGPVIRIMMIQQQGSWGPLAVSCAGMQETLAQLNAFPEFIEIIQAFGRKVSAKDETFSTFRTRASSDKGIKETAYIAKFVEEHNREEVSEAWSLRKMGIYHRSCPNSGETFMILNPARSVQLRLKDMTTQEHVPRPDQIHLSVASAALEGWRCCVSDIEERCSQMKTKAHLTRVDVSAFSSEKQSGAIDFEDIQDIQVLQDKLELFQHALDSDCHVFTNLQQQQAAKTSEAEFGNYINVADAERLRVTSILRRLSATSDLVARILDFRCQRSLDNNSRMLTELIRYANDENALIIELGKKASHDADVVKMLTFVALVYLPASFTATVMDMGYISVQDAAGAVSLEFKGEFFVFLVLTAIFLLITLGAYFIWLRLRKSSWRDAHRSSWSSDLWRS